MNNAVKPRVLWVDRSIFEVHGAIQRRVGASDFERQNTFPVISNYAYDTVVKERDELRSANLSKQIFLDQIEKESRQERDALAAQLAEASEQNKAGGILVGKLERNIERLERALAYAKDLLINAEYSLDDVEKLEHGE